MLLLIFSQVIVTWGTQMELPNQMLNNKHIWHNHRENAAGDGFKVKKDSELLDSITYPTLTLVTLGKFFAFLSYFITDTTYDFLGRIINNHLK